MNKFVNNSLRAYQVGGGHSCSGLRPMHEQRELAVKTLEGQGLPLYRSEAYQRTDLNLFFPESLPLATEEQAGALSSVPTHLALSGDLYTLGNGRYDEGFSRPATDLPKGAFVGSFTQFYKQYPEVFAQHYAQIAKTDTDGAIALNTLFAEAGFVLYLQRGVKLPRPIYLSEVYGSGDGACFVPTRLLVIMEEETELQLHNSLTSTNDRTSVSISRVVEIYVGRGAKLHYTNIEKTNAQTSQLTSLYTQQSGESECNIASYTLSNGRSRNNFDCNLLGEYAKLSLGGFAIASEQSHIDNYSYIAHSVPHCQSNELFKYLLTDRAYGVFTGRILVAIDAQKTEAYQNNRNLLLSADARMQAKPQLEIYADDVRCSHGMTTGQLDSNALFYLRQRGISLAQAKLLLSIAFTEDAIRLIEEEATEAYLRELVEERIRTIHL